MCLIGASTCFVFQEAELEAMEREEALKAAEDAAKEAADGKSPMPLHGDLKSRQLEAYLDDQEGYGVNEMG